MNTTSKHTGKTPNTSTSKAYDLLVIGAGPAGQKAAIQASKIKKKVAIIDDRVKVGGVCVHMGTIPSKSFREAVLYLSGFRQRNLYGSSYSVKSNVTMEDLKFQAKYVMHNEIDTITQQLSRNNVEVINGHAHFIDAHSLEVASPQSSKHYTANNIAIAVGAKPHRSPGIEFDGRTIFDSDDLLEMTEIPDTMTVIGGGVIGLEYASMFIALGVCVTVVDGRERLLEFVDREVVEALLYRLRSMGGIFRLGESVESCTRRPDGKVSVLLKSGKVIVSDCALFSAGRVSATKDLGLEKIGVETNAKGGIKVNEFYQTSVQHVYAVGDVIGFPALASTAAEQGRLATCHMFHVPIEALDIPLPFAIYSIPEIAIIGSGEQQLTNTCVPYEVGLANYREITKGHLIGDKEGLLKIIFHSNTQELLGVHIVGEHASELIHIGQAVLAYKGKLDYLVRAVFNYPSLSSCYKVAALDGYNKLQRRM